MLLDVRSSWLIKDGHVLCPEARVPKKRGMQTKEAIGRTAALLASRSDLRRDTRRRGLSTRPPALK
jgi:hypothetical protein